MACIRSSTIWTLLAVVMFISMVSMIIAGLMYQTERDSTAHLPISTCTVKRAAFTDKVKCPDRERCDAGGVHGVNYKGACMLNRPAPHPCTTIYVDVRGIQTVILNTSKPTQPRLFRLYEDYSMIAINERAETHCPFSSIVYCSEDSGHNLRETRNYFKTWGTEGQTFDCYYDLDGYYALRARVSAHLPYVLYGFGGLFFVLGLICCLIGRYVSRGRGFTKDNIESVLSSAPGTHKGGFNDVSAMDTSNRDRHKSGDSQHHLLAGHETNG